MKHFLLGICVFLYAALVSAATYECIAVDNKAVVATDRSVSITSDSNTKTCSFSVGGASTGKQAEYAATLNGLIQGRYSDNMRERDLRLLLIGAMLPNTPSVSEIDFENAVRTRMRDFEQCVSRFRQGGDASFKDNYREFSCVVYKDKGSQRSPGVSVTSDTPVLGITFRKGNQTYQLFLPQNLFERAR